MEDLELIGGREPFGLKHFDLETFDFELKAEKLKFEGLIGYPFDPAQGKGNPLYMNPVLIVR